MKKSITKLRGYDEFKEECFFVKCETEYPGWTGEERFIVCADLTKEKLEEKYPEICEYISPYMICGKSLGDPMKDFAKNERKFSWRSNMEVGHTTDEKTEGYLDSLLVQTEDLAMKVSLKKAIDELTETQRRRLILLYFGGYTFREIAKIEKVSEKNVFASIDRAVESLRKKIT